MPGAAPTSLQTPWQTPRWRSSLPICREETGAQGRQITEATWQGLGLHGQAQSTQHCRSFWGFEMSFRNTSSSWSREAFHPEKETKTKNCFIHILSLRPPL